MDLKNFKRIKLPDSSGVYFFRKGPEILYIGKATSLRDRVRSYFSNDLIDTRGPLLVDMVFKADNIKYKKTDSALEALMLEANLIKKYKPYYNTREKDDRSFLCVVVTKEKLPRVLTIRAHELANNSSILGDAKASKIYGPFTNGMQLREALKIVRKIFPFLDDKNKNYLEFYKQINLAPDVNDRVLYLQNIKNIKLFFEGKKKMILKNLEREMKMYAKARAFERAGEVKRQIFALQHINDIALIKNESFKGGKISSPAPFFGRNSGNKVGPSGMEILPPFSLFRIEAYDIAHMSGKNMVGVMTVLEDGEVAKNEYKKFKIRTQAGANDVGALKEVLERRLAHTEWTYPNMIVMDGSVAQVNLAKSILKNLNISIPVVSVVKDDRHKARGIMGDKALARKYEREILLVNSEAHRFAIAYHKNRRANTFIPGSQKYKRKHNAK